MTVVQARQLTQRHRAQQLLIRQATKSQVAQAFRALDPERLDDSFPKFAAIAGQIVTQNRKTSAGATAQYLRLFRKASGVPGEIPAVFADSVNAEQLVTSLRVTSVVAVKKAMTNGVPIDEAMGNALTQAAGASSRHVLNASRETMLRTAQSDDAATGWQRVLGGGGCDFCQLLAGRVYPRDNAGFDAHDHCGCTSQIVYEGQSFAPPPPPPAPEPARLQEQAVIAPEEEYVQKIVKMIEQGNAETVAQLRKAAVDPATKPLSKANIEAALERVQASVAAKAAAVPSKFIPKAPTGSVAARVDFPAEALEALLPTRGGWTTSTRAKTVEALKRTPEGRNLLKTMDSFQSGGSTAIPRLRTDIEKYLTGNVGDLPQGRIDSIETFLSAVGRSDAGDRNLFRGMSIPGDMESVAARYKVGDDLDLSLASFSSDKKLAQDFTLKGAGQKVRGKTKTPVLIEWVGEGKRALPIERLSKSGVFANEKEWVGAGRYSIEGVKRVKKNGVETLVLTIRQKGVW